MQQAVAKLLISACSITLHRLLVPVRSNSVRVLNLQIRTPYNPALQPQCHEQRQAHYRGRETVLEGRALKACGVREFQLRGATREGFGGAHHQVA